MSSVDDDFCESENEASQDQITVHLLPNCNQSIESTSNAEVSYIELLKHHREYRWYLLSSLVTDAGE